MTIYLHRNIYHAELTVPKDVRHLIGRRRFRKTLQTTDIKKARRKEPIIVAAWKEQIAIARGDGDSISEYARQYKEANYEGKKELEEVFQDMVADDFGKAHYSQLTEEEDKKALIKYQLLTGKKIRTDILLNEWLKVWDVEPKGKDQGSRYVHKFCQKFKTPDEVNKSKLLNWCMDLINHEGLSNKTVRCILSPCRVYWEFLEMKGHVDYNPFINIKLKSKNFKTKKTQRRSFSREEICLLFHELKKNSNREPELFHMFQIGIYTGARIEEICQIKTIDVTDDSFKICDSKTRAGIRELPIHTKIQSLMKNLKSKSTNGYLISKLKSNKYGQRSAYIGKKFGRLKTNLGFDSTKVFHSIRMAVSTQLEQADVYYAIIADILGHEKRALTYDVYSDGSSMKQKVKAIEKINYF